MYILFQTRPEEHDDFTHERGDALMALGAIKDTQGNISLPHKVRMSLSTTTKKDSSNSKQGSKYTFFVCLFVFRILPLLAVL